MQKALLVKEDGFLRRRPKTQQAVRVHMRKSDKYDGVGPQIGNERDREKQM